MEANFIFSLVMVVLMIFVQYHLKRKEGERQLRVGDEN